MWTMGTLLAPALLESLLWLGRLRLGPRARRSRLGPPGTVAPLSGPEVAPARTHCVQRAKPIIAYEAPVGCQSAEGEVSAWR